MSTESVVIIGAGPAGTAAAITARRKGMDVVAIDKAVFPRDKCCGDGLTTGALRHLEELGVDPHVIPTWKSVTDVHISTPTRRSIHFSLPHGPGQFAATVERRRLDAALVDQARSEGADVREGVGFESIALFEDHVRVVTDDGCIDAEWCIAADGMWSPTRKTLGLSASGYRGEWHAFRQYWTDVSPGAAQDLFVWFEPDLVPGYLWSFPLPDGRANVGFGVSRATHRTGDMAELWPQLLSRPHVRDVLGPNAMPEAPHRAWPIPARVGRLPLTAHRTFFVGDAAAACDPMTGEGIGQALQTGIAAIDAITTPRRAEPVAAAVAYEDQVEHELAVDMRFADRLGSLLASPRTASAALGFAAASDWTRRNFVRWLFEDYPRAVIATPRRWSPARFGRPGAFADS